MRFLFIILTVSVAWASTNLDDEIIKDLDFFQNLDLVRDEDSIKMTEEMEQMDETNVEAESDNEKT